MTEQQVRRLQELLLTEMPLATIATELGFGSYNTFRLRLAEAGLEISRVVTKRPESMLASVTSVAEPIPA